ncbi:aspartate/glutamate racemase family protein [Thermodesulfobacteriota bacterium]
MLKILWQDIFTPEIPFTKESALIWDGVMKVIQRVKSPSTQVDQAWLPRSSELNWYPYIEMLNNLEILNRLIKGKKKGYDAAIIGCYCDPGLREARGLLDIPVVGLSEAAMMFAQTIGGRFACVTVWESYVPMMERNLRLYGFENRAISNRPIRYFNLEWPKLLDAFKGDGKGLIQDFESIALSCVEDGADVVIVGCAYLGPALTLSGYTHVGRSKVPVIDCTSTGVAMAEAMAGLHQRMGMTPSRSKTSPYPSPPPKKLSAIRKNFGFE